MKIHTDNTNAANANNDSFDFLLYATLVSFALAKNLEPAERNLLGIFLQEVGGNLSSMYSYDLTMIAIRAQCENKTDNLNN